MEVHFTSEQEAQLSLVAARAAVRAGIAEADRGEFIEDDEVRSWLESQELPGFAGRRWPPAI